MSTKPGKTTSRSQRGKRLADRAELIYVNEFDRGYTRRRRGRGFSYLSTRGKSLRSARTLKRIKSLAIPPAWEQVWICPRANGHIQARGRDDAGRRQYIYHPRWKAVSSAAKFDRMGLMASVLPRIRRRVRKDLNRKAFDKRRMVAAAVRLIDRAHLRVGDADNTRRYGSHGVTTLTRRHLRLDGVSISLDFPGKSGQHRDIDLDDAKLARVLDRCEDICGQFLFCFQNEDGQMDSVESEDINDYLRDVARIAITAKDFRTWAGSVEALSVLVDEPLKDSASGRKKQVANAVRQTAALLGNTAAVARGSYIHPGIVNAALSCELETLVEMPDAHSSNKRVAELTVDESRFAALLPSLVTFPS